MPHDVRYFAVAVEFDHAGIDVAVTDKERPVRQPGDVGWTREMRLVIAGHPARTNCL